MVVPDFDTSRNRECEECHRKGFDEGDWLFMGWDDEAELYICPECQSIFVPTDDDLLVRTPEQRHEAETGTCPACDGIAEMKILWFTLRCSTCHGTGHV